MPLDYTRLSKTVSHALRHQPWLYELEPDAEGWVPIADLLTALRERRVWHDLDAADIAAMVAQSDKRRYEMCDGRIRALYGHSLPGKLAREAARPPAVLYHGTGPAAARSILAAGLRPMGRQYVHLSVDRGTALQVGRRKSPHPIILAIDAAGAFAHGVPFYRGNDLVWLADAIPPHFVIPHATTPSGTGAG